MRLIDADFGLKEHGQAGRGTIYVVIAMKSRCAAPDDGGLTLTDREISLRSFLRERLVTYPLAMNHWRRWSPATRSLVFAVDSTA